KSEVAERLAGPGPGTYLATALVAPGDDDFAERVARHRARRPAAWVTVEEPRAVPGVLARLHGPVLLDALGTWIANDPRPGVGSPEVGAPAAAGGGFRQALGFLTPLGGAATPTPAALVWFPVVGALLGLVLGVIWWAAERRLGPLAAAALVVTADLALTGALHFDGLLDSADGLLPHLRRERRLAVMADPHVGTFAIAVGASALLLRSAAIAGLGPARPWLLAALWSLARTAMAVTVLTGRYARSYGLASSFLTGPPTAAMEPASASGGAEPDLPGRQQ